MPGNDAHDMSYYSKCMVGGILSCGLTHALMCPLDIIKCRKQVRYFQIRYAMHIKPGLMSSSHHSFRLTPRSTRVSEMASAPFTEQKDSEVSLS